MLYAMTVLSRADVARGYPCILARQKIFLSERFLEKASTTREFSLSYSGLNRTKLGICVQFEVPFLYADRWTV